MYTLILWAALKSGALHFTYVKNLPNEAECVALAQKVAVGAQYHCVANPAK